jgi:cytochrome c551/c552
MGNAWARNLVIFGAALGWVCVQPAIGETGDATELLAKYNCQACHALDKQLVGPAFKDVAAKYAGETEAHRVLKQKIKSGGSGAWGTTPMPPNNVPDADLEMLVSWILAQK